MPSSADDLRALLCDLFRGGDELLVFLMRRPKLRALVSDELRAAAHELARLAAAVADAAHRSGRTRELLDALAVRFPGRRAAIDALTGRTAAGRAAHLVRGPTLPVLAARGLALVLFAGAVALPWLATWQGVLVRPELAGPKATLQVQYRPEEVWIPGDRFVMGGNEKEQGQEVELGALYVARTEVTLSQWEAVMGTRPNDCNYGCDDDHPVSQVSWNETCEYVQRLTELENEVRKRHGQPELSPCYVREGDTWTWPSANHGCTGYRLPTEAEWEYFAWADVKTLYFFGDDPKDMCDHGNGLDDAARRAGVFHSPRGQPPSYYPCDDGHAYIARVGTFAPNRWNLYDVHGNVAEQLWDKEDKRRSIPDDADPLLRLLANPLRPQTARILRGSDFNDILMTVHGTDRRVREPWEQHVDVGFRVVRSTFGPEPHG